MQFYNAIRAYRSTIRARVAFFDGDCAIVETDEAYTVFFFSYTSEMGKFHVL